MAYNSVHGRYFAGKQVKCEFVSLTRWKVAICGEYMKSRLKTCSRGSACNFLHCFSNPGGDYEWADCDKPPPRYWVKKMTALFGFSDDSWHDKEIEQPSPKDEQNSSRIFTSDRDSYHYKRHWSMETNQHNGSSSRSHDEENHVRKSRRHARQKDDKSYEDETEYKNNHHRNSIADNTDSDGDWLDRDTHRSRRESSRSSSRHNRKESKSRDYYGRSRTHGSNSDEDFHTERRRVYTKKRPRRRKNVSDSSNDDGESDGARHKQQIEMQQSSSEPCEVELQRHKEQSTNSSRHHQRSRRHDGDEGIDEVGRRQSENEPFAKKQKRYNRKSTTDKSIERHSLHRYDRSRSHDSEYLSDKNDNMSDRWEPNSSSNEHDKHSSKVSVKDSRISDEIIDTRKPKDERSSNRKRHSGNLEEKFDNSEDISKSSHGENRQSHDRDHRTREKRKRI